MSTCLRCILLDSSFWRFIFQKRWILMKWGVVNHSTTCSVKSSDSKRGERKQNLESFAVFYGYLDPRIYSVFLANYSEIPWGFSSSNIISSHIVRMKSYFSLKRTYIVVLEIIFLLIKKNNNSGCVNTWRTILTLV